MKSISNNGSDDPPAEIIESRTRSEGTNRCDFEEFCGIWSDTELTEFEENMKDLRKINHEDWQ